MSTRRVILGLLVSAPMLFATGSLAADYTPAAFEAAQKGRKADLGPHHRSVVHHLRCAEADPGEA